VLEEEGWEETATPADDGGAGNAILVFPGKPHGRHVQQPTADGKPEHFTGRVPALADTIRQPDPVTKSLNYVTWAATDEWVFTHAGRFAHHCMRMPGRLMDIDEAVYATRGSHEVAENEEALMKEWGPAPGVPATRTAYRQWGKRHNGVDDDPSDEVDCQVYNCHDEPVSLAKVWEYFRRGQYANMDYLTCRNLKAVMYLPGHVNCWLIQFHVIIDGKADKARSGVWVRPPFYLAVSILRNYVRA
jgi:hypothetical protein